jgi:hypothetical protein
MAQQVGAPPVTPFGPTLNISNLDIPAGDSEDVELYFDISLPTAAYTSSIIFNADADNVPFIEVSATGTIE